MDLSELRDRTRLISGIEMPGLRSDAEVDDVINDVYFAVVDMHEWPFLRASSTFTTSDGTKEYPLPGNIEQPHTVTFEDDSEPWPISRIDLDWYHRWVDEASNAEGEPYLYARKDMDNILLAPVPDDSYTIQVVGQKSVSRLTAEADTPVFADRFHPVIAYQAAAVLLDEEGRYEDSQAREDHASRFLTRMRRHYLPSHDTGPIVMGSGGYVYRWPY